MNNKRKFIIAALLFTFLGLTVFTFANPNEQESILNAGNKNEVTDNNQVNDSFNQEDNNNVDNAQKDNNNKTNNNVITKEDNSYKNALAAVVDAEKKLDTISYDKAAELVEQVTTNESKKELSDRLKDVKNEIDIKSLVITLETMTNEATNKDEMDAARIYREEENIIALVDELTNEILKENLQTRLNTVAKLLDDEALELNIDNESLLKEITKIEILDANELTITLTNNEETKTIQNGEELSDGVYTLNVVDRAFNEQTITFTIDTSNPMFNIEGDKFKNSVEVIIDDLTFDYVEVYNKDKNTKENIETNTFTLTEDGVYTLTAYDKAERSSIISFYIDAFAPEISDVENGKIYQELTIKVTDKYLNEVLVNDKLQDNIVTVENNKEFTKTFTEDGTYTIVVKDEVGHTVTRTFMIDGTAPELTIVSPEIYQLEVYTEYTEKGYSAIDTTDGDVTNSVKKTYAFKERGTSEYISVDSIDNSKVGTYKITYTAYDKLGNTTVGTREVEFVDTVAPVINLPGTLGKNKNELHVESGTKITYEDLIATVTDSTAVSSIAPYKATLYAGSKKEDNIYNIKDFTNGLDTNYVGRYNIEYTVTDKGGNTTTKTMLLVMTDTTAPVINLPGTLGKNKNELHVEYGSKITFEDLIATVTDSTAVSSIAPYQAHLLISNIKEENKYNIKDFTNGLDTNYVGRYNIEYMVTDKGGNTTISTMLLIMRDTEKPVLTAEITLGRTFIKGIDKTHLQFNVYKDGKLKHSFNSKTSDAGKYFSLSTGWFGDGEYTIEAIDEGNNKTTLNTVVTSNAFTLIKYTDSVKLTKDVTLNEVLEILEGQDKVIDLNGYTLTVQNTDEENKYAKQPLQIKGKLTIKDSSNGKTGTLVNDSSNANGLIENYATGNVILDDITIKDKGTGTLITNNGGKATLVKSDLVTEKANSTVENNAGDLTIKETNITIKGKAYATWIHSGNVIIEDTNINSVRGGMNIDGGNVVVNDTNITLNGNGTTQSYYAVYVSNKNDSKVTINGGTFTGSKGGLCLEIRTVATGKTSVEVNGGIFSATKDSTAAVKIAKDPEIEQIDLNIKGGTFKNTNVTTYLAKGYEQNLTNWTVTLNEIFNDSVKLTKNVSLNEVLEIMGSQDKVIDLNGNTLTIQNNDEGNKYEKQPLQNKGKLTIKNGTIVNDSSNTNGLIENHKNGNVILDNVKIEDNGTGTLIKNNGGKIIIANNTEITIKNPYAAIENNGGEVFVKDTKINGDFYGKAYPFQINAGNTVIENTDITSPFGGINIWGGTVTITNTNVEIKAKSGVTAQHAIYIANAKDSNVTINSGTFTGRSSGLYLHAVASEIGKISVKINGGTFSSTKNTATALVVNQAQEGQINLTIKGGKFAKTDITKYLAEGYEQNLSDWKVNAK